VYPLQTHLSGMTLDIRSAPDMRVVAERSVRLRPTTPGSLKFTIDGPAYEASFQVSPMARPVEASRLTKVTGAEHGVEIWEAIRLITQRGQLPTLTLQLKGWPHALPEIDAPGAVVSRLGGA